MIKKLSAILLSILMVISAVPVAQAAETLPPSFVTDTVTGLFAHGAVSSADTEAWQMWQNEMQEESKEDREDKNMVDVNPSVKYFFMPSGSSEGKAEIYNGFTTDVTLNETVIPAKTITEVSYTPNTEYSVTAEGETYTLIFKKSTAEAAIYINNTDADGNGTELYSYLSQDKSNSASATAALVNKDGSVDNTGVKKIKGRGNTTWKKLKKPFNITYTDKVSIDGMEKGKKFSLLANYQDGALIRNRVLYDLSDAVGMPYASDSRFVDLYINGVYYGSYQIAQKIEVGSSDLINDIDDGAYLNADGTLATDFPFVMEVDPSASSDDYTLKIPSNGTSITIKAPEIKSDEVGYSEVKEYVKTKFTQLYRAINTTATKAELEAVLDIDSFAKIYLINELSKNWDMGVSSLYLTYKQDSNGNWKFFASPVWDYDNSLGNALGVAYEFDGMDGTSQEEYLAPTGWWCKYKGSSSNLIKRVAKCTTFQKYSAKAWVNDFVPAIKALTSTGVADGELYSADVYYNYLVGTADCNYTRGWFLDTNPNWIADHTKLTKGTYDEATRTFISDGFVTTYEETFEGEYNYTIDWLTTRAHWLTAEFMAIGDTNGDGVINDDDNMGVEPEATEPSEETEATKPQFTEPTASTQSTIPTAETTPSTTVGPSTDIGEDTITKTTPKITKVKAKSTTSIKISWKKLLGANGYVIYQKKAGGAFKKIKTINNASTTSYTVKKLKTATKYSYKIKALITISGEKYYSKYSNTKTTATKPKKVTVTKVTTQSSNVIYIKWKKVANANGYKVYKKASGKLTCVATTGKKANSTLVKGLNPSTKYTLVVKAYVKAGGKAIYSTASKAVTSKTKAPTYNNKGNYKLYTNVPDFGKFSGASLVTDVFTTKTDGLKCRVYAYHLDTMKDSDIENYSAKLLKKGFKYYGSGNLNNGDTILYYNNSKTVVGISVTSGYFYVACSNY